MSTGNNSSDGLGSHDKEKGLANGNTEVHAIEDAPDQVIAKRFGVFGPLLSKLFQSGVEARGVERVPENQRETKNSWNNLLMWWSVNMVLTTIPVGVLAQYAFTLTLPHAVATIFCFAALGSVATAFIAILGPQTGLRTMIISRYSSGYLGGTFFSVLNIITQLGFATTAVILGGQTLASTNANTLPLVGGIIIIGVCSLIPCFIGYNIIHVYERYAWMATLFIMCCLYGLGSKAGYDVNAQKASEDTGRALSADILSFGAIVFGSVAGWAPVAADYNVRLPVDTNPWRVFVLTFCGLFLPIVFTVTLGATLMTIGDPVYADALGSDGNTGALVAQVLSLWGGGGKFLLVLLALSVVSNNIPNTYSAALSIQALGRPFAMVPRFLWVLLVFVAYTVAGVAGREHFSAILSNFLSILSYWTAFFIVIVAEEHFLFRQKEGRLGGYNLADWDNPSKLPIGIAGLLACCFGIVGAVVGMSQVWYTGPIGKMAGAAHGADLGFELAAGFAAVTFPPLRWMEIRLTGR
ncbi:permease for cytosine/purines, uracil, thiamine, allantoin-domain-containing protein [Boletus edulis BED1]|uniref:Permease for cytosine/purines, uracil, thiamine, allantoin-domain-containing protein n=1 Tax=Boletus edulis BED1 TaxID=1328754 RepID=A0AAD4BPM2_BOLED|nr:permease for cytosine/purines, uracil, thiamine, allantoin-domain-containing protein [Boletus edulis BED1]